MRILIRSFLLILLTLFSAIPATVQAQSTSVEKPQVVIKKRQLLVQPRDANGNIIVTSFWEDPVLWARDKQQQFYGTMNVSLRILRAGSSFAAAWALLGLGFAYGVFHAAGPGHGKVVISSWLLATENDLKRGLLVAFLSSLFQALTAIIIVSILLLLVASVGAVVRDVTGYLESASYAMISLLGLYMVYLATRAWFRNPAPVAALAGTDFKFEIVDPHFDAGHVHDENCGHAHAPTPQDVRGADWSLKKAVSLSFAIGLRPCTGAILVLLSANALGLYWAGVASTLAMGFGVFITVGLIATITVYGKNFALKLAEGSNQNLVWLVSLLRIGGGAVLASFGAIMFLGSLSASTGMM
jgi:nickel/cobalt transporter (NicO) family protein